MPKSQDSFIMSGETVAALPAKPWWLRRARHVHIWHVKRRNYYYQPAGTRITLTGFVTQEQIDALALGFTVVLQQCDCGKYQQEHLIGRVTA